jgi:hypothetical protein
VPRLRCAIVGGKENLVSINQLRITKKENKVMPINVNKSAEIRRRLLPRN